MEKNNNKILIALTVVVIALLVSVIYLFTKKEKIVYVDSVRLFEEYKMKQDFQSKIESRKTSYKKYLDSSKLDLKVRYESMVKRKVKEGSKEAFEYVKAEQLFFMKEKEYNDDIETISAEYTTQIWKQLNQYTKEYGELNSYDFIFGAKGDGNLMHARASVDVTESVIKFVNNKYEGSGK
jgi:outer membrane protein